MTKTPPLDWMPAGRTVSLRPAGKWWDAVRVPRVIGLEALGRSGGRGAVMEDPGGGLLYWLVPAGEASGRQTAEGARILVLGDTTHVAVPGPQRTSGPRRRVPPTRSNTLTDPSRLHNASAQAAALRIPTLQSLTLE
ncbi:hypothetical protein [Streptomyces mirabilis]|uniref:hypothetical protein n=1 Tax=Streptomyces mirabilis TaxID=68239 RepID=UPI00368A2683